MFSVPGHTVALDIFKESVRRGKTFRAAAFSLLGGQGQAYIVREFVSSTSEKDAKEAIMKQLVPKGTVGLKFPGTKLTLKHFHKFDAASVHFTPSEILHDTGLLRPGVVEVVAMDVEVAVVRFDAALFL